MLLYFGFGAGLRSALHFDSKLFQSETVRKLPRSFKGSRARSTASLVLPDRRSPLANHARVVTPARRRFFASGVSPPGRALGTAGKDRCEPPGTYLSDDNYYQKIQGRGNTLLLAEQNP